ncbi:hypothetical protein JZ751_020722 [Albula glossodonta]|uniref:Tumour suppressor p53-binding protein-1 Tudor domain-containing protein n=1 Tax=Albula glossodonta TaxID=121402 RepID=A0A8T2PJA5_9TELE|nr:hypothetical protein JZ751_020722 [Albula glossodonta]
MTGSFGRQRTWRTRTNHSILYGRGLPRNPGTGDMDVAFSATASACSIYMDPGGSELESSLSQLDNPCLIVEDSQPDSAALEEDPDSSYHSLLARRLSNLQPTSPSPVLELISSPAGSRCSQPDSLVNVVQSNTQQSPERSTVKFLNDLTPLNRNCVVKEMDSDAGVDSTTQCAQSEGGTSQFGFLELSESQGLGCELGRKEESQAERARTPPKQAESQREAQQGAVQKASAAPSAGSQGRTCKRPEVSSSCSSEPLSGDRKEMSIQHLLHGQGSEVARELDDEEDDTDISHPLPSCTPANSLRLLHLSGQAILVQESLSQNSIEYVAPTQENLSQTPLIVPNSPTAREDEQDEPDGSHKREEEPMEMDQTPVQSKAEPKPQLSASTPASQHSIGLALEKSVSVPTLPELSHDIFVPTQSQETGSSSDKAETLRKKAAHKERHLMLETGVKHIPSQSQHNEVAESFQLELSALSENSSFVQQSREAEEGEDSQATQIEGACVPNSSLSESQSMLPKAAYEDLETQDMVVEVQAKSPNLCIDSVASVVGSSQNSSQKHSNGAGSMGNKLDIEEEDMDEEEKAEEATGQEGSGLCLSLSQSQAFSPEPMEEECSLPSEEKVNRKKQEKHSTGEESSSLALMVEESERISQQKGGGVVTSQIGGGVVSDCQSSQTLQKQLTPGGGTQEEASSSKNGTDSQSKDLKPTPDKLSQSVKEGTQSNKAADLRHPRGAGGPGTENSGSKSPSDSSGGMSSFSERSAGDVTRETDMVASEITVEDSGEAMKGNLTSSDAAEPDGKLSLRMKLVTPVEEGSSGSEHFSLQKPALSEEEGTVSKVTTVVKAVTSHKPSPSVFSRVCEARRQVEAEEKALPSMPCTPSRDSERKAPRSQGQRPKVLPRNSPSGELSASPQEEGTAPASIAGSSAQERALRLSAQEKECAETPGVDGDSLSTPVGEEGETNQLSGLAATNTPPRHRAVSQQTSFDMASVPSPPSRLRQRAVSQQTSFEATGPLYQASRGEPETPPPRAPPGQAVRRHMRIIREVRTTVTRIITDVYYENGQEVDRKVTEESEEPVVDCRVVENDISPSRTGSSMTSGDLADVSSFSSKTSSLQHSSSGASSGGPGPTRRADFIAPSTRGAKSSSPRKGSGQQQRAHRGRGGSNGTEDRERIQGTQPLAPLTPRGRARRGRPPSRGALSRGAISLSRDSARGPPFSSSEDEPYTRVCAREGEGPPKRGTPSRSTVATLDSSPDTSGGGSSFVGLRVVAKWSSNGYFYSGCITRDMGDGRFRLLFDDSYECDVPGKDILLCDPIPVETEVTALSEDEYFSTGVVKGHKTEGSEFFYCVEKDGQRRWYGRMAVILSMEQGNRLREQYGLGPYEPATPLTKASDISLDNLVEGKRKRRGNMGGAETPSRSSSNSPRTPGPSGKRKLISSTDEEKTPAKRGRKSAGPRKGMDSPPMEEQDD